MNHKAVDKIAERERAIENEIAQLEIKKARAKDHQSWAVYTETSKELRDKRREYHELREDKQ